MERLKVAGHKTRTAHRLYAVLGPRLNANLVQAK